MHTIVQVPNMAISVVTQSTSYLGTQVPDAVLTWSGEKGGHVTADKLFTWPVQPRHSKVLPRQGRPGQCSAATGAAE